jgi:hypothetical protein
MMRLHGFVWVGAGAIALGACGPRVSVGDLGNADAGQAGDATGATTGQGGGGATGGGSPKPVGGMATGGMVTGGMATGGSLANADAGEPPVAAAGQAGAGGLPDWCASTLTEHLEPPVPDCPDELPSDLGAPCDIIENGICTWQSGVKGEGSPGFDAYGCYAAVSGKAWFGISVGTSGEVGENPQNCPKIQPAAGSSCAGHSGENCYYMEESCSCGTGGGDSWSCEPNAKSYSLPLPVQRLCPPQGLDEAKQLKDLTDEEVEAWCGWYGDPSGEPRPPVTDNDPPDEALSYPTRFSAVGASACMMELPIAHCITNIRLRPDCTATVGELDDCIETLRVLGIVGHGCGPLLANPTCENVIAQAWDPQLETQCYVPLK